MNLLFYYLNRIFDIILWPFSSFPRYVDILFISLISAIIFLFIFKKTSNQQKIKYYKERMYGHIIQIFIYKDQLRAILQSILGILKNNVFYIGYMLPPLLFIIIPLWIFTIQINNRFGYSPLENNQTFIFALNLDMDNPSYHDNLLGLVQATTSDGIVIETDPLKISSKGSIFWRAKLTDPRTPQVIRFFVDNPKEVLEKQIVTSDNKKSFAPEKSKWHFFRSLTTNAEAFIPDSSPFKSVLVSYQRQSFPLLWWNTDPIILYFVLVLIFSFLLKPIVKVNI